MQLVCFRWRRLAIIPLLFHCPLIFFAVKFPFPISRRVTSFTPSGVPTKHPTKSPLLLKQAFFEQHFDTFIYLRSSWCRCISPACNSRISFHKVFRLWAFHLDLLHGRRQGDYFLSPCARIGVAVGCLAGGLAFDHEPSSGIKVKWTHFKEQSKVRVQSPGHETAPAGRIHSAHQEKYFPSRFGGISRLLFPLCLVLIVSRVNQW